MHSVRDTQDLGGYIHDATAIGHVVGRVEDPALVKDISRDLAGQLCIGSATDDRHRNVLRQLFRNDPTDSTGSKYLGRSDGDGGWRGDLRAKGPRGLLGAGGIALPNFVIAGFMVILFVFLIPLLPVAGWGTIRHMLLPGFCLGLVFAAYIARLTRTGMLEALSSDHIRTAHAKGLSSSTVVMRHALKGGLLPVVSYLGPATAGILTGSLVIESIFFISGTGQHFIRAAINRDYTLAMGVTILFTVLVYVLNTVVDIAYTLLDPRISLEDE